MVTDIEDRKQAKDTLLRENVALREEVDKASMFEEIVGTSPVLKAVLSRISKVAPSNFYGSHNWRNGHRQRARCAGYPPTIRSQLADIR